MYNWPSLNLLDSLIYEKYTFSRAKPPPPPRKPTTTQGCWDNVYQIYSNNLHLWSIYIYQTFTKYTKTVSADPRGIWYWILTRICTFKSNEFPEVGVYQSPLQALLPMMSMWVWFGCNNLTHISPRCFTIGIEIYIFSYKIY